MAQLIKFSSLKLKEEKPSPQSERLRDLLEAEVTLNASLPLHLRLMALMTKESRSLQNRHQIKSLLASGSTLDATRIEPAKTRLLFFSQLFKLASDGEGLAQQLLVQCQQSLDHVVKCEQFRLLSNQIISFENRLLDREQSYRLEPLYFRLKARNLIRLLDLELADVKVGGLGKELVSVGSFSRLLKKGYLSAEVMQLFRGMGSELIFSHLAVLKQCMLVVDGLKSGVRKEDYYAGGLEEKPELPDDQSFLSRLVHISCENKRMLKRIEVVLGSDKVQWAPIYPYGFEIGIFVCLDGF